MYDTHKEVQIRPKNMKFLRIKMTNTRNSQSACLFCLHILVRNWSCIYSPCQSITTDISSSQMCVTCVFKIISFLHPKNSHFYSARGVRPQPTLNHNSFARFEDQRPGTHYPHVTWAHVMLRLRLGCERRFNIALCCAYSHLCHSVYVTWSQLT
jgi:hypothetical protein